MIVMDIHGDFGSQLFEYAMGYSLAKDNRTGMRIDISQYNEDDLSGCGLTMMNLDYNDTIRCKHRNSFARYIVRSYRIGQPYFLCKEQKGITAFCDQAIKKANNKFLAVYYSGYWKSYKYFDHHRNEIIKQFIPKMQMSNSIKNIINMVITKKDSVAVHIARKVDEDMKCLPIAYYKKALGYMKNKHGAAEFYFFSEDIAWCKQNFGDNPKYHFVSENNQINELEEVYIMSSCHHQIISNCTNSWWAAYLNLNRAKEVVAPLLDDYSGDYYPEAWIKLAVKE